MGKRRQLTDIEMYYVKRNPDNLTAEEMAIKLNCNITILGDLNSLKEKVVESASSIKQNESTVAKTFTPEQQMMRDSFQKNKKYGATVATPAASQLSDETRASRVGKGRYAAEIHKPYGDQ